jgi:hypothetical protein
MKGMNEEPKDNPFVTPIDNADDGLRHRREIRRQARRQFISSTGRSCLARGMIVISIF